PAHRRGARAAPRARRERALRAARGRHRLGAAMAVTVRFVGSGDSFGSGGRFQTCILVDGPSSRFAIDFGTSSLIALAQQGIEHNSIDAILLTHRHGDHCGGVPFLLIDAMLGARRSRPLTIAGPRDLRARMDVIREALFPGSHVMTPKFEVDWIEMEPGRAHRVLELVVTPQPARHTRETNPTALRVEVGGKVVTYTGDTEWTDEVAEAARGADLLIAEPVAEEIRAQDHEGDHEAESGGEPPSVRQVVPALGQHQAPGRPRRLDAHAEEA